MYIGIISSYIGNSDYSFGQNFLNAIFSMTFSSHVQTEPFSALAEAFTICWAKSSALLKHKVRIVNAKHETTFSSATTFALGNR